MRSPFIEKSMGLLSGLFFTKRYCSSSSIMYLMNKLKYTFFNRAVINLQDRNECLRSNRKICTEIAGINELTAITVKINSPFMN